MFQLRPSSYSHLCGSYYPTPVLIRPIAHETMDVYLKLLNHCTYRFQHNLFMSRLKHSTQPETQLVLPSEVLVWFAVCDLSTSLAALATRILQHSQCSPHALPSVW